MRHALLILALLPGIALADAVTDGVVAPIAPSDLADASRAGVGTRWLSCDETTDPATMSRAGLIDAARAAIDVHRSSDRVLVDATLDATRWVFHAAPEATIHWDANPDRITLARPGAGEPSTYLIDGRARFCPETRVLVVDARQPDAASLAVTSTPATQQVAPGASATLQIKILNNGTESLAPISVSSTPITTCSRTISSLAPGFSYTYTCTRSNVQGTIQNTVTATGTYSGGSISGGATSTITTTGGNPEPTGTGHTIARIPWVQYARPGETARWRVIIMNGTAELVGNINLADVDVPSCANFISGVAIGGTVIYDCSLVVPPGPGLQKFTMRTTFTHGSQGPAIEGWSFNNGVITDYIHVDGMDGCRPNGASTDFCSAVDTYIPMLRRLTR